MLAWPLAANAVPTAVNDAAVSSRSSTTPVRDGWRLFGGFGLGYGAVSSQEFKTAPKGSQVLLNVNLGYQTKKWVSEAGLGWFYNRHGGQNSVGDNVWIRTRSGLLETSLRYRIGERWQIGPIAGLAFGTDTTQSATTGKSTSTVHAGVRTVYEFPYAEMPLRVWQQITTDLSTPQRRFVYAMIGLQVGIFSDDDEPAPQVLQAERLPASPAGLAGNDVRLVLDTQRVFFKTNSSKLKPEVEAALNRLGIYLQENQDDVDAIDVSGHADQRGAFKYNQKLSEKRAISVADALKLRKLGVPRVSTLGLSYSVPLDPQQGPSAWAKNRRVEILFKNVRDVEMLEAQLKPLRDLQPAVE